MSKEDIWISRTRVPITGIVQQHVNQNFDSLDSVEKLELWNLHVPKWAPIEIVTIPGSQNRVLQLSDEEPYDYACAERHFPPRSKGSIEFSICAVKQGKDILEFEIHNENDERVLRLRFDVNLEGINLDLGSVEPTPLPFIISTWFDIKLKFDCLTNHYDVWINGNKVKEDIDFDIEVSTLERMVFRTGSWRSDVRQFLLEGQPNGPGMDSENLPAAGEKVPRSVFWIDNVRTMDE
jgi:hypothetical protein